MLAVVERRLKVLIVDDSLTLQRSLTTLLAPVRDVVIVGYAEGVANALARINTLQPDLVVLDVALNGRERGFDVLQRVVREHPGIKVIMLSNFTWRAMRTGMLESGAYAYFNKGDEFTQARDCIAALAAAHVAHHLSSAA